MVLLMSLPFGYLCLFLLFYPTGNYGADMKLVMVQILYRHGDRSPVTNYPNDPINESAWPQGFGQLSKTGMVEHYKLGQYLRSRYIEGTPYTLLSSNYSRYEIEVNSTDYDRTLMSAYSNLAGLYAPNPSQVWDPHIDWQPIPVHTRPLDDDHVLHIPDGGCPKFDEYYQKTLMSPAIVKEELENADFYKFLSNYSGIMDEGLEKVWEIYDTMFCEVHHNFSLPDWATQMWNSTTVYDKMAQLESLQFDVRFDHPIQSRLTGGPLLKAMVSRMKEKAAGTLTPEQRKAFVYSAHDTTVAAFLSALKVFNRVMPPYASCVMVELYEMDDGDYSVGVFFRNGTSADQMHDLTLPNCSNPCPFHDFLRITSDNIPDNWEEECQLTDDKSNTYTLIIGTVCSAVILIVVIIVGVYIFKWRKNREPVYFNVQDES